MRNCCVLKQLSDKLKIKIIPNIFILKIHIGRSLVCGTAFASQFFGVPPIIGIILEKALGRSMITRVD